MIEPRCYLCEKKFSWYRDLNKHIDEQHGAQFRCAICQAYFLTTWDYECHISEKHGGQYRCLFCKDVYYDISELHEHSLIFHDKPLQSLQSPQSTQSSGNFSSPRQREHQVFTGGKPKSSSSSSSFDNDFSQKIQDIVSRISLPVGNKSQSQSSSVKDPLSSAHKDDSFASDLERTWGRVLAQAGSSCHKMSNAAQDFGYLSVNDESWQMLLPASVTDPSLSECEDIGCKNQGPQREAQQPSHLTEKNLQQIMQDVSPQLCYTRKSPCDHFYYSAKPKSDGLYYCPFTSESCTHKPDKLKCNYE